MKIILLGAPGSGKGSEANLIKEKFNIPHISTGDIFRENIHNKTSLGILADSYISKGQLVPDEVTIQIVKDRLLKEDCKNGYILDGFPRTVVQAEMLEQMQNINVVLLLDVAEKILIERLTGRRTCIKCGQIYHTSWYEKSLCEKCNGELSQRADDTIETVLNRLKVYNAQTKPLIDFYSQRNLLKTVDGKGTPSEVFERILELLEGNKK